VVINDANGGFVRDVQEPSALLVAKLLPVLGHRE
jgi:hypothetical protein